MLLAILKKTLAPFGALLLIIIALLVARSRFPFLRIIPSWVLILAIVVILVIWLAVLFIRWLAEKRRAQAIEDGILSQAQSGVEIAAPARRAEIAELKKNLSEALATLKSGPEGKKALYSLPWYLIIGPPAVGKTTAIVNSSLNFPGMTTAKRMRGTGGTRNCDWWFSTDAILLDTAGRYADSIDRSETEAEWFSFLDLLRAHRKQSPIDGLILAYSVEDLYQKNEAGLVDSARELRLRMDEILDRLGWTFPVYLLFTKCDLISGFSDYFASLSPLERQQVWGAIYRPEPHGDQRAAERFAQEFDTMVANLRDMRPGRMSSISKSENWGRVFMFPEEFANLRDRMVLFMETLFEANPYRKDVPIFRGTYFSSGRQLGKPFELVARKIQQMLGAGASFEEAPDQDEKEDAYFVRDLFAKVLKADRNLVRMSARRAQRYSKIVLLASTCFLVFGVLACIWIGISHSRLRTKLTHTRNASSEMLNEGRTGTPRARLVKLEPLQKLVDGPWGYFPLYVADDVRKEVRAIYHQIVSEQLLRPAEERISQDLSEAYELPGWRIRQALRAELMLLMPERERDIDWNAEQLAEGLYGFGLEDVATDEKSAELWREVIRSYLADKLPLYGVNPKEREDELRTGANRIAKTHTPSAFMDDLVSEASQVCQDIRLAGLVGEEQSILKSGGTVRAAFTRSGWNDFVKPHIADVENIVAADNRLIQLVGGNSSGSAPSEEELCRLYRGTGSGREGYSEEWSAFFRSIRYDSYSGCELLEKDLHKLSVLKTSPLFELLRNAHKASELGLEYGYKDRAGGRSIDAINSEDMRALSELVAETDGQPVHLAEFAAELAKVRDQVTSCASNDRAAISIQVLRTAKLWFEGIEFLGNDLGFALKQLMSEPIDIANRLIGDVNIGEISRHTNAQWDLVFADFESISGDYPFRPQGETASLSDVLSFYGSLAEFQDAQDDQSLALMGPDAKSAMERGMRIRRDLRMNEDRFEANFTLRALGTGVTSMGSPQGDTNLRNISMIVLTINGERLEVRMDGKSESFTWTSEDENLGCSLALKHRGGEIKIESEDTIWGICQLFDKATISRADDAYTVTWPFPEQGVQAEFRLSSRVEPFFIRNSAFRKLNLPSSASE